MTVQVRSKAGVLSCVATLIGGDEICLQESIGIVVQLRLTFALDSVPVGVL